MASEAATNQIAADIIPYDDLADFDRCKRKFGGNPSGVSLLVWKWKKLLDARGRATEVTEPALVELGQLVDDRNALIHYSLMDEATRLIFDRPPPADASGMLVVWSAHEVPTRVEEGRILRLMRADAAALAVKRADDVFAVWNHADADFRRRGASGR